MKNPLIIWPGGWHGVSEVHDGDHSGRLTQECLRELRLWPGCETVEGIAVLADIGGKFAVRVVSYGLAKKKNADRALR